MKSLLHAGQTKPLNGYKHSRSNEENSQAAGYTNCGLCGTMSYTSTDFFSLSKGLQDVPKCITEVFEVENIVIAGKR